MTIRPLVNPPNMLAHTGFMLAEEESLKSYLSGITVPCLLYTSPSPRDS